MSAKPSDAAANRDALDELIDAYPSQVILDGLRPLNGWTGRRYPGDARTDAQITEARSQLAAIRAERDAMRAGLEAIRKHYQAIAGSAYPHSGIGSIVERALAPAAAERSGET